MKAIQNIKFPNYSKLLFLFFILIISIFSCADITSPDKELKIRLIGPTSRTYPDVEIEGYVGYDFEGFYHMYNMKWDYLSRLVSYETDLYNHSSRDVIHVRIFEIKYQGDKEVSFKAEVLGKIYTWNR